jgi:hypothetical protein
MTFPIGSGADCETMILSPRRRLKNPGSTSSDKLGDLTKTKKEANHKDTQAQREEK